MADCDKRKQQVFTAVNKLSAALNKVVEDGRANFDQTEDINKFVLSRGAEDLHGLLSIYPVQLYADCFKSLGVKSRVELEAFWSQNIQDEDLQESVEELLRAEEGYKAFVEELDQNMNTHEEKAALPVVSMGEHLHTDVTFVDGSTGGTVSLNDLLKKSRYTLFVLRKHFV